MENKNSDKIEKDKWYTISDLVKLSEIGIFPCRSKLHINRLLQSGKLKGVDVGVRSLKQWRIKGDAVINFINGDRNNKNREA